MKLWIVSGPTSAGKSHLLSSPRAAELTSLEPSAPVLFPFKLDDQPDLTEDAFLHYNILRPAQAADKQGLHLSEGLEFQRDGAWAKVLAIQADLHAIVLVADAATLARRARNRELNEVGGRRAYKTDKWLALLDRVDLDAIYDAWRSELDSHGIPYIQVDATSAGFPVIEGAL